MITQSRSPIVGSAQQAVARFTTHQGRTGRLLSVAGKLAADNADQLLDHVHRAMCCEWLVLDLTAVEFIDVASMNALHTVNARCAHFDVRWSLVAGRAVSRLLRSCDRDGVLPVSESLTAALASVQKLPDWRATTHHVAGSR
ncbi:STAS domain-containing protein [Mycolicibacterium wolinskyi]|nr:STAS domain-containing protein [Mycolicibacterium wolinskyi]MCV7295831.1 STAS domain-containing protein [Mycolicibacterium goodii]